MMFRFILAFIFIWLVFFVIRLFMKALRRGKDYERPHFGERQRKHDIGIAQSKITDAKFKEIINDHEKGEN